MCKQKRYYSIHIHEYRCILCYKYKQGNKAKYVVLYSRAMAILYAYSRFIPHLLMILVQIGYSFLYFLAEAAFSHGMSPHVFVTYRYIVGGLVMFPLAYFLERYIIHMCKHSPKKCIAKLLAIQWIPTDLLYEIMLPNAFCLILFSFLLAEK